MKLNEDKTEILPLGRLKQIQIDVEKGRVLKVGESAKHLGCPVGNNLDS
jgi:hypothetical protein